MGSGNNLFPELLYLIFEEDAVVLESTAKVKRIRASGLRERRKVCTDNCGTFFLTHTAIL